MWSGNRTIVVWVASVEDAVVLLLGFYCWSFLEDDGQTIRNDLSYRYVWKCLVPNTHARSLRSIFAYLFSLSVSVRHLDANRIGRPSWVSTAPSASWLASTCRTAGLLGSNISAPGYFSPDFSAGRMLSGVPVASCRVCPCRVDCGVRNLCRSALEWMVLDRQPVQGIAGVPWRYWELLGLRWLLPSQG